MTQQQKDKMLTYMIPREWFKFNKSQGMRTNMFIRIHAELTKHDFKSVVYEEILEDVIMETFQYAFRNDKFMAPNYFVRRVKTYYFRELYKRDGLSQSGKPYKDPKDNVYISYQDPQDINDGKFGYVDIDGNRDKETGIDTNPENWYKGEYNE